MNRALILLRVLFIGLVLIFSRPASVAGNSRSLNLDCLQLMTVLVAFESILYAAAQPQWAAMIRSATTDSKMFVLSFFSHPFFLAVSGGLWTRQQPTTAMTATTNQQPPPGPPQHNTSMTTTITATPPQQGGFSVFLFFVSWSTNFFTVKCF